jgi:hypothetical protein
MKSRIIAWTLGLLLLVLAGAAAAQTPPKDNEGFEPVASDMMSRGESIPANRLVGAAYGFIFAAVTVWVGSVAARTRRVEEEIEGLKRKLERR